MTSDRGSLEAATPEAVASGKRGRTLLLGRPLIDGLASLGPLPLQRSDSGQVLQVPLVDLAGRFMRRGGFRADQREGSAASLRDMGAIATIGVDDAVQMAAAFLGHGKAGLLAVRIGQEGTQRATVGTLARQLVGTPVVGRLLRRLGRAVFQLAAAGGQPTRNGRVAAGQFCQPRFQSKDRGR